MSNSRRETLNTYYRNKYSAEGTREKEDMLDFKEANNLRQSVGLKPIEIGEKNCLKCDNQFLSSDTIGNRLCSHCRSVNNDRWGHIG